MKVVLDTNVLVVSIPLHTRYYPIFDAFLRGHYSLCITTDILAEYAEILHQKYALRPLVAENVLKTLENSPDVIMINKWFYWNLLSVDPDDNKFVDCAIAANADFIVTNDKHFDVLRKVDFPLVKVISTDDFLKMIAFL
jgi:putative PIN family toxin of toxin-antitoxin system